MAGQQHYLPVTEPSQQPFNMSGGSSSQNDEVVVFFQNCHNRPGGNASLQQQLRNAQTGHPGTSFPTPYVNNTNSMLEEHEAAGYFLSRMGRDLSVREQGTSLHAQEINTNNSPSETATTTSTTNTCMTADRPSCSSDSIEPEIPTQSMKDTSDTTKTAASVPLDDQAAIKLKPTRRMTPEEKIAFNRLKHPIKPPCKCPRKCFEKITEERQADIHFAFWSLSYVQRSMFLMGHVKRTSVQRKTVRSLSRRKFTMKYTMYDAKDQAVSVCKLFFLATFGFQSDKVVTRLFTKNTVGALVPEDDMRGKHPPANKIDAKVIRDHIQFFCKHFASKSSKSKKLIVPLGITKMQMYNDFKMRNQEFKCGPSRYTQEMKDMNVILGKKKPDGPVIKQPNSTVSSTVSPNKSGTSYTEPQNPSHNSAYAYNRGNNFSLSTPASSSQGQSQVIMYSGQTNRVIPPPPTASWSAHDGHPLYQQYTIGGGGGDVGGGGGRNPDKDPGHSFADQMIMASSSSYSSSSHDPQNEAVQGNQGNIVTQTSGSSNLAQVDGISSHQPHFPQSVDGNRIESVKPSKKSAPSTSSEPGKVHVKRKRLKTDEEKFAYRRRKYPLLPPCKCPKKCFVKINEERRARINYLFWGLQFQTRGMFLLNHVKQNDVKRCTGTGLSRRKFSRKYTLPDAMDNNVSICKVFFLSTLGLTSDRMVTNLLHKNPMGSLVPADDNRGRHQNHPNKIDTSVVRDHIRSHQQKVKGKWRLPDEINVKLMHQDFKMKYSHFKCGLERYRQIVKDMVKGKKGV